MSFLWKALFGFVGPLALIGGAYLLWQHHIEQKAIAPYVAAHVATVAAARVDTGSIHIATDYLAADAAAHNAETTAAIKTAIKETHDEYAKPAGPIACAPSFDLGGLSAPINLLVERAGRAADAGGHPG